MAQPPDPAVSEKRKHALQMLEAARQTLAPGMTGQEYYDAIRNFETNQLGRVRNVAYKDRILSADEMAGLPDNSEQYERFSYRYEGWDRVREMLDDGNPVAFVGWHHGAREHADYALARIMPDIAIFTRWALQYGKVFSVPMGGLGLVKMKRFLEDGRPVFYYLDGAPAGERVQLTVMGINCNFATGPIKLLRSVPGLRIVPVSNFYVDDAGESGEKLGVQVTFHPPPGDADALADMDDRDILVSLLSLLGREQSKWAPAQVLINYFAHRELQAERLDL